MSQKRKCTLCPSHLYDYCNKCKDKFNIEPWRLSFDSETCRDVYHILAEFAFGRKTAMDARKELELYTIPDKNEMTSSLRKNLEDIYSQTDAIYAEMQRQNSNKVNKDISIDNEVSNEKTLEEVKPRRRRYTRRAMK